MPHTPGIRRYIFNTLTVVSLLLLPGVLVTVGLWVDSYWHEHEAIYFDGTCDYRFSSLPAIFSYESGFFPTRNRGWNRVADAGYDSEANHVMLREEKHIRSVIPAKHGRPSKHGKPPAGRWRRVMHCRFNRTVYRRRSQVETVFSMIKRNFGGTLGARSYWSQQRELLLKVLTHNIGILWRIIRAFL